MSLSALAFIGAPGPWELLVVAAIVLLLFGSRLPSAMRSLGRSVVEFKKGVKGIDEDDKDTAKASSESEKKSE